MAIESITLGGGCFWCVEGALQLINGVQSAKSGYSGGSMLNPTYKAVCTGETGHAEVVQVEFDASKVDLETLLKAFFAIHDPTTLNRQGADIGTQYRSVIFYHNEDQKCVAERVIDELNQSGIWSDPIVTEVSPVDHFYEAEDYHQNYFSENPNERYCQFVIQPKLRKFVLEHKELIEGE